MEPETRLNNRVPEKAPVNSGNKSEQSSILDTELGVKTGAEHYEQKSENGAIISDVGFTTTLPAPAKDTIAADDNTSIGLDDVPLTANDDDLIEKEWVDKAKKIVEETHDDPHRQEAAVSRLQVDYLKKRYGRERGISE